MTATAAPAAGSSSRCPFDPKRRQGGSPSSLRAPGPVFPRGGARRARVCGCGRGAPPTTPQRNEEPEGRRPGRAGPARATSRPNRRTGGDRPNRRTGGGRPNRRTGGGRRTGDRRTDDCRAEECRLERNFRLSQTPPKAGGLPATGGGGGRGVSKPSSRGGLDSAAFGRPMKASAPAAPNGTGVAFFSRNALWAVNPLHFCIREQNTSAIRHKKEDHADT